MCRCSRNQARFLVEVTFPTEAYQITFQGRFIFHTKKYMFPSRVKPSGLVSFFKRGYFSIKADSRIVFETKKLLSKENKTSL